MAIEYAKRPNRAMNKIFPLSVACSYARADEALRRDVQDALAPLIHSGVLKNVWYDRKILPGEGWADVISDEMNNADIILLLISNSFLASEYCMGIEVEQALQRRDSGKAAVIPIILRDCYWQKAPFADSKLGEVQVLPKDGKPIQSRLKDARLVEVVQGIEKVALSISDRQSASQTRRPIQVVPEGLPYLCNRTLQEVPLEEAVGRHLREKRDRPFLCVVHGSEDEDHTGFRERLLHYSLPRILALDADARVTSEYRVELPRSHRGYVFVSDAIRSSLASALACRSQELVNSLHQQPNPIVIWCEIISQDWALNGEDVASSFLRFWQEWPSLPETRHLIVMMLVQYQRMKRNGSESVPTLPECDEGIKGFLATHCCFSSIEGLGGVVLDELEPVDEEAARAWLDSPHVRRYRRRDLEHYEWCRKRIAEIFAGRRRIPMKLLAPELVQMLSWV